MYPHIRPEHTHVEKLLTEFAKIEKPTTADFAALKTRGKICDHLDRYRLKAAKMTDKELETEKHSSRKLAGYMRRAGDPRPSKRCACHHIVSGGHKDALLMRLVMVSMEMRIDDPHNGCWLPNDWADRAHMPNYLRNAVPHKRIHTDNYYNWLASRINMAMINSPEQLIHTLRFARRCLQSGAVPPNVMPRTGKK